MSQSMPSSLLVRQSASDGSLRSSSDEFQLESLTQAGEKRKRGQPKRQGACVQCKSLKVRCEFAAGDARCQRCIVNELDCQARIRKKRKPAPTQEDLQARSRQQDEELQSLLRQLDQLRLGQKVEGWVRRANMTRPAQNHGGEIAPHTAMLTFHYYSELIGPLEIDVSPQNPEYNKLPLIIRTGILATWEVVDLFNLFFERINPFFACLDGAMHCPQKLIWINELLFTTICALAARHYSTRPGLHDVLMDITIAIAAELGAGFQSIETVQAFLLLAAYPTPQKKWADDRSWIHIGIGVRMALELELDKPPMGVDEHDNVNRLRTWLYCFTVEQAHATQFGKMPMLQGVDQPLVRATTRTLYKSPASSPYDMGLCAYTELSLLMAEFQEILSPNGTSEECMQLDVVSIAITYDKKLHELFIYWHHELEADRNLVICPVIRYRFHNFTLIASYMRLVVLSQGFQHCVKNGITRDSYILRQSIDVSQLALRIVIENLYPSQHLGWAMEANFLYMAFCAAFLLNLLRPKFLPLLDLQQCATIVTLVSRLISILSSEDVALDGKHSPAVYSKFLSTLLKRYYTPSLQQNIQHVSLDILPQYHKDRAQTPPYVFYWPDIPTTDGTLRQLDAVSHDPAPGQTVRHEAGELEMDFSPQHFIRSTGMPPVASMAEPSVMHCSSSTASGQWNVPHHEDTLCHPFYH